MNMTSDGRKNTAESRMKRACVFLLYDRDGKADDYVLYYLEKLVPLLDRLVVVVNGKLLSGSREKLEHFAAPSDVVVRENKGYDVGGFLEGIRHVGYEALAAYDEFILANDSCYGPVFPFEEAFSAMAARTDLDIWGLTGHREMKSVTMSRSPKGYVTAHVQSYFTVLRKKVLQAPCFKEYWEGLPAITSRDEAIQMHEVCFTGYLEEKGFHWGTYVPVVTEENAHPNSTETEPLRLLKARCPLVKKAVFSPNLIRFRDDAGERPVTVRRFIERKTDYDFNLILKHLIRTAPLSDLMGSLNLYRILPENGMPGERPSALKSAAVFHLYYEDLLDDMLEYVEHVPEETDIFITSPTIDPEILREKTRHLTNRVDIRQVANRGRLAGAYLVELRRELRNYDVVLLFHDKKTPNSEIRTNAESFFYKLAENTLPSADFARGVIRLFETDPYLGVLMPTIPAHGSFNFTLGSEWGEKRQDYEPTMQLLSRLNVKAVCTKKQPVVAPFGDIYWFRTAALYPLLDYPWELEDFPEEPCGSDGTILHALERAACLIAQSRGCYSAYLFNDAYFGLEHAMYQDYLRKWNVCAMAADVSGRNREAVTQIAEKLNVRAAVDPEEQPAEPLRMKLPVSAKLRLAMKCVLPQNAYGSIVKAKRKIFGPHDVPYTYQGTPWEQDIRGIKDIDFLKSDIEIKKNYLPDFTEEEEDPFVNDDLEASRRYAKLVSSAAPQDMHRLSVVIPCYNHEKYIRQRIQSVLDQDYPIHELIFLDDASTDRSAELARRYLENAPFPVRFEVNEKNGGSVFAQWKKGAELATGDILWIAESDDYCRPDFLRTAMKPFADEKVVLSYTESVIVEEDRESEKTGASLHNYEHRRRYGTSYLNSGKREIADYLSVGNYILNVSAVLWKKTEDLASVFAEAGKYSLAGDWFAYLQVLRKGDVAYCAAPLNCYRFHQGTVRSRVKATEEYLEIRDIHDRMNAQLPPAAKELKRQRIREDLLPDVDPKVKRQRIAWVTTAPIKGSGGHRTVIHHVNALIRAGFDCDILLMDCEDISVKTAENLVAANAVPCAARVFTDIGEMGQNYDLVFATTWNSVYPAGLIPGKKAYFIQDYEPWFFREGSEEARAAEKTYRMGFEPVTIGGWLAKKIEAVGHIPAAHYDFCADPAIYHPLDVKRERAICAVYQPEKPRRYADMVCRVFEMLHDMDPSLTLYAYGSEQSDSRLKKAGVKELGVLPVNKLNELYNRCVAGLCISLSNPSRIPFEMMASGLCVVDVDADNNQLDYPKDIVTLAEIDEEKLAGAILELVNDGERSARISEAGAKYMREYPPERAYRQFVGIVKDMLEKKEE